MASSSYDMGILIRITQWPYIKQTCIVWHQGVHTLLETEDNCGGGATKHCFIFALTKMLLHIMCAFCITLNMLQDVPCAAISSM